MDEAHFEEQAAAMHEQMAHEEESIQAVVEKMRSVYHADEHEVEDVLEHMHASGTTMIEGSNFMIVRDHEGGFDIHDRKEAA